MRCLGAIALVTAALLLTGCGERSEPVVRELDVYPVAVRGAAREATKLDRPPERIAALGAGAADLLVALGVGDRLVGVPFDWSGVSRSTPARVVLPRGELDVQTLSAVDPDLVVAPRSLDLGAVTLAARRADAAVYVQPDDSVDAVVRTALELGLLIGEPVRGRALAARVAREVAAVGARVAGSPPLRVFVDTGFFATVPRDSLVADLVRHAGGEPVGAGLSALGRDAACRVLDLRPDVVLRLVEADSSTPSPIRPLRRCAAEPGALPRTARIAAALATHPGPRVGKAAAAVARALHPDAFP